MNRKITLTALLFFITFFTIPCYSQTDTILNKEYNRYFLTHYHLNSFKTPAKYSFPELNLSFKQSKPKTRYSLYDSPDKGLALYDNYDQKFIPFYKNDYKYDLNYGNNFKDDLINGSIEYLLQLIDK
jgi:hypothetical protein